MPKFDVTDESFIDSQFLVVYRTVLDELAGGTHWSPANVSHKLISDMPVREGSFIESTIH